MGLETEACCEKVKETELFRELKDGKEMEVIWMVGFLGRKRKKMVRETDAMRMTRIKRARTKDENLDLGFFEGGIVNCCCSCCWGYLWVVAMDGS